MSDRAAPAERLGRPLMALLAVTVFTTAAAMHFQTPMLERMANEFAATPAAIGWVPTLAFAGFLTGTVFLVPLGDRFDKRALILAKIVALIAAVLAMATAPSLTALALGSFVIGICTSLSQHIVPLVADLAEPAERGGAVGTVLSGLFLGILFGRLVGGFVAATLGWRAMYVMGAAMLVVVALVLFVRLPSAPAKTRHTYAALMRSLVDLYRDTRALRRASVTQLLLGIGYGGFWATLAPMLATLHGVGPTVAGLIGIPGAAGILVARAAGRWMDRRGAAPVVASGISLVMAAFAVFALGTWWVVPLAVGAALLDCGLRAAMVANQTLVTSVDAKARSRFNTVFAGHVWGGNAIGAFLASSALTHFGWWAVCAIGFASATGALVLQGLDVRSSRKSPA